VSLRLTTKDLPATGFSLRKAVDHISSHNIVIQRKPVVPFQRVDEESRRYGFVLSKALFVLAAITLRFFLFDPKKHGTHRLNDKTLRSGWQ